MQMSTLETKSHKAQTDILYCLDIPPFSLVKPTRRGGIFLRHYIASTQALLSLGLLGMLGLLSCGQPAMCSIKKVDSLSSTTESRSTLQVCHNFLIQCRRSQSLLQLSTQGTNKIFKEITHCFHCKGDASISHFKQRLNLVL